MLYSLRSANNLQAKYIVNRQYSKHFPKDYRKKNRLG